MWHCSTRCSEEYGVELIEFRSPHLTENWQYCLVLNRLEICLLGFIKVELIPLQGIVVNSVGTHHLPLSGTNYAVFTELWGNLQYLSAYTLMLGANRWCHNKYNAALWAPKPVHADLLCEDAVWFGWQVLWKKPSILLRGFTILGNWCLGILMLLLKQVRFRTYRGHYRHIHYF